MTQGIDITKQPNDPNEKFRECLKAYATWFGVGSLVGTAFSIFMKLNGVSAVFVFGSLFGSIAYQLKMKKYERRK